MPFTATDLYSSSAGTELFNYWNPFVTKFDSQSFYNFEQDNQPLYDLEERTYELWEKATGYATSSLFGQPLTVSGEAPAAGQSQIFHRNIFTNLQEAINSLPNVIRTPTLIEVATSGDLGGISLKNIKIVEDGVLEIVNRGFAKIYSASAISRQTQALLKDPSYSNVVSSLDLSNTISYTSALSVETNVSAIFNNRCNRTFLQTINNTPEGERTSRLSVGFLDPHSASVFYPDRSTENTFRLFNYEAAAYSAGLDHNIVDSTVVTNDTSSIRQDTGEILMRNNIVATYDDRESTGGFYCNTASSITIENCNGPLYIRGFCVDSVSGPDSSYLNTPYKAEYGIQVINSNPIIENCSVMRATTAGAKFVNSDVTLSRGFFAYRNYEVLAPGTTRATRDTMGMHAINSRITLATDPTYASGADYSFNIQNHSYGAVLENSVLIGGQSRVTASEKETSLSFAFNDTGIKAINSTINVSGNLDVYNNYTGLKLIDSYLSTDHLTVENHTLKGIEAENSIINYNNSKIRRDYTADVSGYRMTQTLFNRNGSHLDLSKGSTFTYFDGASAIDIPNKYGALRFYDHHGITTLHADSVASGSLPAVRVDNSTADLLHSRFVVSSVAIGDPIVEGLALKAVNSSIVKLLGTVKGASIIQGPANRNSAVLGISSENGSTVGFRGPTVIAQFGVGALAENNSTLEFTPHKKDDFGVDLSGFDLTESGNHTSVEVHTTNDACLAATNNSQIIMEDLGSPDPSYYSIPTNDYAQAGSTSSLVEGGSMQFYPNPALGSYVETQNDLQLADGTVSDDAMTAATYRSTPYNWYINNYFLVEAASSIQNTVSIGGFCVRLFGNSVCKVNSVNFPCGWYNTNGNYFDPSASPQGCHQLRIWNIGDDSKLYASHTSVSATQPYYASGYHGPRAVYFSGIDSEYGDHGTFEDSSATNYGALSSTPNTSSVSILDWYGLGVSLSGTPYDNPAIDNYVSGLNLAYNGTVSKIGRLAQENIGPFRLYFSTNSMMKYIGYPSGSNNFSYGDTRPAQALAQGYSLSGAAGLPNEADMIASSMHPQMLRFRDGYGDTPPLAASGYYYGSAMLETDSGTHVYLDEESANIFANAKNCAMPPLSGRASPKVTIYKGTTGQGGEGYVGAPVATVGYPLGSGLRSFNFFDVRRQI